MSEKRISVEEVQAAYAATGIKPERTNVYPNDFVESPGCCGIGVLSEVRGLPRDGSRYKTFNAEYGEPYRVGFTNGFDGYRRPTVVQLRKSKLLDTQRYYEGFEDGQRCATAVFAAPADARGEGG